jgi:hypothetical protein
MKNIRADRFLFLGIVVEGGRCHLPDELLQAAAVMADHECQRCNDENHLEDASQIQFSCLLGEDAPTLHFGK